MSAVTQPFLLAHLTDALMRELLAPLSAPTNLLPGNHDDRDALRRHFGLPGTGAEPVQYVAELGPSPLVVLDSTCPAMDRGELDEARLDWVEAQLAAAPTLIAMHHPPLITGSPLSGRFCVPAGRVWCQPRPPSCTGSVAKPVQALQSRRRVG
jgi:3',5'-cyclic AMP phosphodiesterase CpdA